ncbi:MAG TPA: vitamin K epoxide reductase family protein [Nocardioides sp.]|uniref:vitamin K epoxide reductase family protein n=1 Tax=Nocardioides sp. TaxID=35761 RepID=UPI002E2FFF96|nr:vitamin K epoxide reductase family protein [Nocardioides sp.]HEX5090804.1 vitamin K epoxide reductase family protein [Nocardioides sp.]
MTVVPRPLVWASFVIAIAGLLDAVYLAYEHASGSNSFACPETGHINCAKVTTSTYSELQGIPVAYLGLAFFVVLVVVMSPWAWASRSPAVRWGRVALVTGGLVFTIYLVWAELYRLDAICVYCTGVHVAVFLLFVVTLLAEATRVDEDTSAPASLHS